MFIIEYMQLTPELYVLNVPRLVWLTRSPLNYRVATNRVNLT